jgi:hypothetical protein
MNSVPKSNLSKAVRNWQQTEIGTISKLSKHELLVLIQKYNIPVSAQEIPQKKVPVVQRIADAQNNKPQRRRKYKDEVDETAEDKLEMENDFKAFLKMKRDQR